MNAFFSFLAPPLVGAFIGYMTNYVAIRMLFRPLRPWRLLGLRIPMTPGVIPAKRHKLAKNIGKMVGSHLLTKDDISRAIGAEPFQHNLKLLIEDRVHEILQKDLGPAATVVPAQFRSYFDVGVKILRWRFLKYLHAALEDDTFVQGLQTALETILNDFLSKELDTCLSSESRDRLCESLQNTAGRFLASPALGQWLTAYINQKGEEFLATNGCIKDLVPDTLLEAFLDSLEQEAPHLLRKLAAMMEEPPMQKKIAARIAGAVINFTASLGPLAAVIGNFVSPDSIEEQIRAALAEKGQDIAGWLIDEKVQQKLAASLRNKAEDFLAKPVAEFTRGMAPEKIEQGRIKLAEAIVSIIQNPAAARSMSALFRDALSCRSNRPLRDILADLFGETDIKNGREWTAKEIIRLLRSPQAKRMLDNLLVELIEKRLLPQPIGPLADFLPKEVQTGVSDALLQQVNALLVREVPDLVEALNIREVVARKVDSLDLGRLEGLLLSIMEEQFKYINLFGAILGFIIGLANLLFLHAG